MLVNRQFSLFFLSLLGAYFTVNHAFPSDMFSSLDSQYTSFSWFSSSLSDPFFLDFPGNASVSQPLQLTCYGVDFWVFQAQAVDLFSFLSAPTPLMISKSLVAFNNSYILTTINFKFPA